MNKDQNKPTFDMNSIAVMSTSAKYILDVDTLNSLSKIDNLHKFKPILPTPTTDLEKVLYDKLVKHK